MGNPIDTYIAAQPEAVRPVLERLRAILRKALPDAEEAISYGIPTFKIGGRAVVFFAGWKAHVSLYPATGRVATELAEEIAPYKVSKGTLQFPLGKPIPARLISRIAKLRAEETRDAIAKRRRRGGGEPMVRPQAGTVNLAPVVPTAPPHAGRRWKC